MLQYLDVLFMAVTIQCAPETDPDYKSVLSPHPTAYVEEFDSVNIYFEFDYVDRLYKIMINKNITVESYTINSGCEAETVIDWMVYFFACSEPCYACSRVQHVNWTILNVTQENHGDMWTLTQFQGDYELDLFHHPGVVYDWSVVTTITPFLTTTTLPTTIFVKGYIQTTTVSADVDDKLTVQALVTKRYPDGDKLFLDIKAKLQNETEATAIPGTETKTANQSDENGLFAVVWKSTAALTEGQYIYNINYSSIVLASPVNGTFCVASGCVTGRASVPRMELPRYILGVTVVLWSLKLF